MNRRHATSSYRRRKAESNRRLEKLVETEDALRSLEKRHADLQRYTARLNEDHTRQAIEIRNLRNELATSNAKSAINTDWRTPLKRAILSALFGCRWTRERERRGIIGG